MQGRVVGVTDGDTLTVLDAAQQPHKVRLAGIDAPESGQAYGQQAKLYLSDLVFGQQVDVVWQKRDRYERIVGKVMVATSTCRTTSTACPRTQDVCHAMLAAGLSWWYRKYASEQPSADARLYEQAEQQAQRSKVGLWALPGPVAPWEWRQKRRHSEHHSEAEPSARPE